MLLLVRGFLCCGVRGLVGCKLGCGVEGTVKLARAVDSSDGGVGALVRS